MKTYFSVLALAVVMLSACGGGGSSSTTTVTGDGSASLSHIDWPVSVTRAITAAQGSAPTRTADQAMQEMQGILENADIIAYSDALVFTGPTGTPTRVPLTCSGFTCRGSVLGIPFQTQISQGPNLGHDRAQAQPIMVHNGIHIAQVRASDDAEGDFSASETVYYGGWMEHSLFAAGVLASPKFNGYEYTIGSGVSLGDASGSNPVARDGHTATWTGAVVGGDYSVAYREHVIHGTAEVEVDFTSAALDVRFSDLTDLDTPTRSIADMEWSNVSIRGGSFSQGSGANLLKGQFYGPNHEEVGGVFDRNEIAGAFGGRRGTQ